MARTTTACLCSFYYSLLIILAAFLSYAFFTFPMAKSQIETPLPLPSFINNSSRPLISPLQPPPLPPQVPSQAQAQAQAQDQGQVQFSHVHPRILNSTLPDNKIDLSNFLRDFSARIKSCNQLAVSDVKGSESQYNSPARNVIDNNFNTRWSNLGLGSSITLDFGSERFLCNIDIAWYRGDERVIDFVISVSNDSGTWKDVVTKSSSGTTSEPESYDLPDIAGRYLRITVTGSSLSDWVSISEARVFGALILNPPGLVSQVRSSTPNQPVSCTPLAVSSAIASGSQANFPPQNIIDNNISTRWANHGLKSSVTLDLGKESELCSVNVYWYRGNERTTDFIILISNESNSFTDVLTHSSTGSTSDFEGYNLPDVVARYVRIIVTGSSESDWVSISEIKLFGV